MSITKRFNSSDYGSGEHNNLKREKSEMEHPGPPPPSTGNKSGSSASSSSSSSSSSQPESGSESSSKMEGSDKPKPKIFSASPPKKGEEPEDVKRHNEEMDARKDKPMETRKG